MKLNSALLLTLIASISFSAQNPPAAGPVPFKKHAINAESKFEAGSIADFDRDGKLDIFSGGFWYEAPGWKRHFVREVPEMDDYFCDFANLPLDVDGDGYPDVVNATWHDKRVFWERNPGAKGGPWEVLEIDQPGNMETAIAADINGDGQLDILPNIAGGVGAWYDYRKDGAAPHGVKWEKHLLTAKTAGHGLGAGDVDGDGKCDIITIQGWLRQTGDPQEPWAFEGGFYLGSASIPVLVWDVNGDGLADLIWGNGHNYGLFWTQQGKGANGKRTWTKHEIDKSWSQPHYLLLADLDNDGKKELVTGKRYRAHNGHDPGSTDPLCVYYYSFDSGTNQWTRHTISHNDGVGFGINTMAVDIDNDGDIDILCPGKSGLYLMENLLK